MKRIGLSILIMALVFGAFINTTSPYTAEAAVADTDWIKAASISPRSPGEFGSENMRQSLRNLKAIGANYVTLIIPFYQSNRETTAMFPKYDWNTPTDQELIGAIDYAHSIGLKVMLKPHLEMEYTADWRGNIDPWDRDAWFASYTEKLLHYGRIAEEHGVEDYCIGTELRMMSTPIPPEKSPRSGGTNTERWIKMIDEVRSVYSGRLTYSANHTGESEDIEFWPHLDYIGLSAYYDLYHAQNNSPEEIMKGWTGWTNAVVRPLHDKWGKDIVFTELGYRSIREAYRNPWDWGRGGEFSEIDQANSFEALFQFWDPVPWMKGISVWRWDFNPNAGGQGDMDYMPQNKLAQQTLASWWGGTGTTPTQQSPVVTGTASSTPTPVGTGQTVTISAQISVSEADLSNGIVQLEVHNSSGQRVHQQIFGSENIMSGQSKTYSTQWTAGTIGSYKIVVSVFSNNWTQTYLWNGNADVINVTEQSGNTDPGLPDTGGTGITMYRIGVENPKHNSTLSGIVSVRARLPYIALTKYSLSWQVDDEPLSLMTDSYRGTPVKEAAIDVSNWNWNGNGPYKLHFIAKNGAGSIISKQTIHVMVDR